MEHAEQSIFVTLMFVGGALVLVLINGFFVAAEFAIVKVRRTRLQELAGQGVAAARISILCVDQLDDYLSATQLGITLVSLGLGWIGEEAFFNLFKYLIPIVPGVSTTAYHAVATGVAFFIITLLHVVLGELVPKSMAIQKAEKITLVIARPLRLFYRIARPLIKAFTYLATLVLKLLGYDGLEEPALSEEELKLVMKESHEDGVISEAEAQIINRAFAFSDKRARDIMTSRERAQFLSLNRTIDENLAVTRQRMYTRFPLVRDTFDNVIGTVHMKDAWIELAKNRSNASFEKTARPPVFVDPRMRQDKLLKVFNESRTHLAVVRDPRSKKNLGVVTIEDVLEELVGDIKDEHGN